jgi:hypothetical protein
MKLTFRQQITQFAHVLQNKLFPALEEEMGELSGSAKRLAATLEMIPLARFVPSSRGWIGRPSKERLAIASAFVAKAVYGFTTTRQLLEALQRDDHLRRLCGWNSARQVPHEATFSRAFHEFARMELPQFVHEALIRQTQQDRLIGHIAEMLPPSRRASGFRKPGLSARHDSRSGKPNANSSAGRRAQPLAKPQRPRGDHILAGDARLAPIDAFPGASAPTCRQPAPAWNVSAPCR